MLTLTSLFDRTLRLHHGRIAIRDGVETLLWGEFGVRIARAASVLRAKDIGPGDRYAIVSRNNHRIAELIYAGYWIGAVPVPVNFRLAPPEIAYVLEDSASRLVVVEERFADLFDQDELVRWRDKVLLLSVSKASSAQETFEKLAEKAPPVGMCDAAEQDEALLLYTGGTTGRPKGVPLSHLNVVSNALQLGIELGPRPDDVYLHVAPMFHSADVLATPWISCGAAHVYIPRFSGRAVLEAIERHGVTTVLMTPTMIVKTLQEPDFDRFDKSSLRQILYGSSPITVETIREMLERFKGAEAIQLYGLTETSPILTLLPMSDHLRAVETGNDELLHSIGRQLATVDLRIIDDAGQDLPAGEAGEIVVRGPNVVTAYLNRPEATEESFIEGWFHTGDIGRLDEDGYLYLLDRKKDLIITGGELVFSAEVEAVLSQHARVHECAVIGIPDEVYGEALLAAIVPMPNETLADEELIEHCRGKIGGYKIPRRYVYLDRLPRSAIDKVLKTELRKTYGGKG